MTKKIKILRNADLRTHRPRPGKPKMDEAYVNLRKNGEDADIDLAELPEKKGEHTVYEVLLKDGFVFLVEGLDFKFVESK